MIFTGLSYLLFDKVLPAKSQNNQEISQEPTKVDEPITGFLNFEGPKTEVCPINGQKYTVAQKNIWMEKRPLLVMIENHSDARPQSGLNTADLVYEAIAEGGITRFMAIYYCDVSRVGDMKYDVGPVRSARSYFLDLASEYSDYPLYTHVGGANCSAPKDPTTGRTVGACTSDKRTQAIEQINQYGWTNKGSWSDLSQFSLAYKVCRREPDRTGQSRATEHTMYCSTRELWNIASDRGLTSVTEESGKPWNKNFVSWKFDDQGSSQSGIETSFVEIPFWQYKDYVVWWKYDATNNDYVRWNGGEEQIDHNDKQPIRANNVIVQYVDEETDVDIHKHNLYEVIGKGKAILIQQGKRIEINWTKTNRQARTIYKDSTGQEVKFVPGKIWVEIVSKNSKINYEAGNKIEETSGIQNQIQTD